MRVMSAGMFGDMCLDVPGPVRSVVLLAVQMDIQALNDVTLPSSFYSAASCEPFYWSPTRTPNLL